MTKPIHWKAIGAGATAAFIAWGAVVFWIRHRAPPNHYVTAPATRGDVTTTTASGTINPVLTVQVGTFVSGVIDKLACDYNTRVSKGQLCAKIDPAPTRSTRFTTNRVGAFRLRNGIAKE